MPAMLSRFQKPYKLFYWRYADFAYAEIADRIDELADVAQLVEQLIRNQ